MEAVLTILLFLVVAAPRGADAQAAAQFAPTDIPSKITSRLVFRKEGLAQFWKDPKTQSIVIRDRVVIEPDFWHDQFKDTGGVAVLSPSTGLGFTITSDYPCLVNSCTLADNASQVTPELNFDLIPNAMLVGPGGHLVFKDILLLDFAYIMMYQYTDAQPYRNVGVGWPLWPTLAMAPGSQIDLINVSIAYQNPAPLDTCEQYTERTVYALQQQYGNNVSAPNTTTVALKGPLTIQIVVQNASNNSTCEWFQESSDAVQWSQQVALIVTGMSSYFEADTTGAGLAPRILAAAIVAPIIAVLAAAVGAWLCWRRQRQNRRSARGCKSDIVMAVEMGHGSNNSKGPDAVGGPFDQHPQTQYDVDKVSGPPGQQAYMPSHPHASSSSAATSSVLAANTWSGSGHGTSGGMAPAGLGGVQQYSTASGGTVGVPATRTVVGMPSHMAGAVGAAGLAPVLSQEFSSRHPSSGGTVSQGQPYSGSYEHPSDAMRGPQTAGSGDLDRHALMHDGAIGLGRGGQTVSSSGQRISGGSSADGNRGVLTAASGGSGGGGLGGTGDAMSSGSTGFRSGGAGGVPALLKARSDMAVLRDLKIGPLLGRGSYGRVYKGRWKAVTVAVKIIEHMEGSPGTASGGGKKISIGREAQLATNIAHPNVVQTYQISTMTVSQRNALARTWMEEGNGLSSNLNQLAPAAEATEGGDNDSNSSSSNDGNDEPQKDVLETWMIMEFCEKGSLDRAVVRKRFIRKDDGQPEMIGIYKALLDTASGLDYLHSIGVVHGDLKTANVLLKGSARDVRGFACKITDFGLSRVLDLDATHISTRTYGTIVYMPSELLLTGRMTQATDIYSFGLMMWELYMSCRIFNEGLSVGQIFYMIAYQNWRPDIPPGCPEGYASLMQACWHQDPEQRPTAQQVLKALQRLYVAEKQAASAAKQAATAAHEAAGTIAAAVASSPFSTIGTPSGHGGSGDPQQQGSADSAHTGGQLSGGGTSGSGGHPCQHGGTSSGGTPQRASAADRGPAATGVPGASIMLAAGRASYGDSTTSSGGPLSGQQARGSGGHISGGGPDSGSGGQGGGSEGSVPHDGQQVEHRGSQLYQPWAQAAGRVGQQLQEDWQEDHQQQRQPQQLAPRKVGWQPRAGPLQSVNEHIPVTGSTDNTQAQAARMGSGEGYSLQTSYPVHLQHQVRYGAMAMQPGDDDGIPSESLYQNDSLISNIAPDDDAEDLDLPRAYGYDGNAQIAAGYLDAVQTATRTNSSVAAAAGGSSRMENNYPRQTPFQYEQPSLVPRPLPGMRASQISPGASVSSSTLGGGWGSVSTGTMPSVIGGNSSLNLSMMASQSMTPMGTAGAYGAGGSRSSMSPGSSNALQQSNAAAPVPASASSPFAALAHRAGSLFGPLVKQ